MRYPPPRRRGPARVAALMLGWLGVALAAQGADSESDALGMAGCPNAGVFSEKLVSGVCWNCMFPIRMAGTTVGSGKVPDGAASRTPLCSCPDDLGIPQLGVNFSLWEPARLVEVVRMPGCSMALGGTRLPVANRRMQGSPGYGTTGDLHERGTYHYRYYALPLLRMLDLFFDVRCSSDGFIDFDIMYMSELDPTWNNPELALFVNPEAAAVANPLAIAACTTDAVSASAGTPIDDMFWCAGTWGHLYPLSWKVYASHGMVRQTSLLATRAIAAQHRRGLEWRTMGADTRCGAKVDPILTKSQYKFAMFYPSAQTSEGHVIGADAAVWGAGRAFPGTGEDALYMLWRWNDCCISY